VQTKADADRALEASREYAKELVASAPMKRHLSRDREKPDRTTAAEFRERYLSKP
jgi:hypothetical protein